MNKYPVLLEFSVRFSEISEVMPIDVYLTICIVCKLQLCYSVKRGFARYIVEPALIAKYFKKRVCSIRRRADVESELLQHKVCPTLPLN